MYHPLAHMLVSRGGGVVGAVEQLGREGGARVAALVRVDLHREPAVVLLEVRRLGRHHQHLAQPHARQPEVRERAAAHTNDALDGRADLGLWPGRRRWRWRWRWPWPGLVRWCHAAAACGARGGGEEEGG